MELEKSKTNIFRPFPSFPPSVWGLTFASFTSQDSEYEAYTNEVEGLKEKVESMLMQSTQSPISSIEFINILYRLGVSYHFESEIDRQLNFVFNALQNLLEESDFDLYTVGVLFHVLRQHGYKMPCDVFKKFKNGDGEFSKDIAEDVKGLLSLYEASFLSVHGEDILDEALEFSKKHLQIFVEKSKSESHLIKYIRTSLEQPFHRGVPTIKAFYYISFYEKEDSRNETLLRFAKLDYNMLQLLYRKEVSLLSRWWNDLNVPKNFPYARDRIVEGYIWILGTLPQPERSLVRLIGSKCLLLVSILDDTYDTYGKLDELELFTHVLERWNLDSICQLPKYMNVIYRYIMEFYDELDNHQDEGIRSRASYAKKMFIELARCFLVEAKWIHERDNVPPFHEYLKNAMITGAYGAIISGMMTRMEELNIADYEWMKSNPKIIEATKLFARLINDIKPHKVEWEQKDTPIGLKSYMNEYNVSKEEAIIGIREMCENAWKDINEACLKPVAGPRTLVNLFLNLARVTDFVYNARDKYTYSSDMKEAVESLLIRQLQL